MAFKGAGRAGRIAARALEVAPARALAIWFSPAGSALAAAARTGGRRGAACLVDAGGLRRIAADAGELGGADAMAVRRPVARSAIDPAAIAVGLLGESGEGEEEKE